MVVARKAVSECPKKVASLIDLVNLPTTLREFVGQSQISHLGCFIRVWDYIKSNNLQADGSVVLDPGSICFLWDKGDEGGIYHPVQLIT